MELSGREDEFFASLTDGGLCSVFNGDSMAATFKRSRRTTELEEALEARPANSKVRARPIYGTGQMYEETFWINLADR